MSLLLSPRVWILTVVDCGVFILPGFNSIRKQFFSSRILIGVELLRDDDLSFDLHFK